ncbi:MAG: hypothetical protein ACTTJE_09905, partial [Schwartzia sp. (in: firmicutes)]
MIIAFQDVLLADPHHPMAEIRRRKKNIQAQLDEILEPTRAGLRSGMKQGVDIVETQEGGTARVSNNAPWYRKWYAEHGRAPSKAELDKIARDLVTGEDTTYDDFGVDDGSPEAQEYFDEAKKQLAPLDKEMASLKKMEKAMADIRPGDVFATATLSKEARGVYHFLLSEMEKGNKNVQKSARASALLAARMTDRLVALHREAGDKDYTAMNALPELLANAEAMAQGRKAAQLFQEEIRTQKEAVRRKYEGTAMWMKAPNGQPTNLTEAQWLLVRTPAFKAWFGDWEVSNALAFALHGEPITSITGKEFQSDGVKLTDKVPKWYAENFNGSVSHPELGEVKLDLEGVKDSLGHGMGREKAAAYAAVPYIIQHGIVYDRQSNWKQRGFDTAVIIAPIEIGGERYAGEVVVKRLPAGKAFTCMKLRYKKSSNVRSRPPLKEAHLKLLSSLLHKSMMSSIPSLKSSMRTASRLSFTMGATRILTCSTEAKGEAVWTFKGCSFRHGRMTRRDTGK